ncbi:MAG: hypothetical protein L0099_04120, partial [Acidobacteria bacterium]|nr:hypothetical protein [Acidobacteriota bacterium]
LGRTASFVLEVRESNAVEVEERIERLCTVFEAEKPYLLARWGLVPEKEKPKEPEKDQEAVTETAKETENEKEKDHATTV